MGRGRTKQILCKNARIEGEPDAYKYGNIRRMRKRERRK